MAKKESKTVKVKALVNLKYDKECKVKDEELNVRVEDALEMVERGYIELLEDIPKEDAASDREDGTKEGE